ncbi:MAG: hypothetical protein E6F94_01155 [Actinobacteria bacterium]|nr:MAG: hypothetical protein E6G38_03985 [Actinomycetota bacterium]TMM27857.1 MAG: hypothetical protein E6F94_01155 [Actinomycetota bacterium]
MPLAADKSVTLPTSEELRGASELLLAALEPVARFAWRVERLGALDFDESDPRQRRPGDEVPTFEHIGQLFSFVRDLQRSQEELAGYVNRIEKGLDDLDHTRLQESD